MVTEIAVAIYHFEMVFPLVTVALAFLPLILQIRLAEQPARNKMAVADKKKLQEAYVYAIIQCKALLSAQLYHS